MDIIQKFFDGSFMPHGHCFLWREDLLLLNVGGDIATAIAYILIPLILVRVVTQRKDLKFDRIFLMFACFILFCGITHMIGIVNIWHGYYYIQGTMKMLTGIISITTALVLWRLLPQILTIPSNSDMKLKVAELKEIEKKLLETNLLLEKKVEERTLALTKLASTDELTNLANRREISRILEIEHSRADRQNTPLSLLMLDIDHFKLINDNFGHQMGDQVLTSIATSLKNNSRKTDFVGRFGGEEFIIILPNTDIETAMSLAEKYRSGVEKNSLNAIKSTCSIGVVELKKGELDFELLKRADQAMYSAKNSGRNCIKKA